MIDMCALTIEPQELLVTVHMLDGIEAHAMASYNDSTLR
jgi:hypothetical protein